MTFRQEKPCFLYVNSARYCGRKISKVGYSLNPPKRLVEFNNSVWHRFKNGFADSKPTFTQFFLIKLENTQSCKRFEREFFRRYRRNIICCFGREVVDMPPSYAVDCLCELVEVA